MAQKGSTCKSKRDLVQELLLSLLSNSAPVINCLKSLTETAISYIAERNSVLHYLFLESPGNAECTFKMIEKRKRTYEILKVYICLKNKRKNCSYCKSCLLTNLSPVTPFVHVTQHTRVLVLNQLPNCTFFYRIWCLKLLFFLF